MNIGETLTALRKARRLSRQKLSDQLHINVHTYIKYESGTSKPPYEVLCRLADFFQVSTDYLLGRELVQTAPLELEASLIQAYQSLPEQTRAQLLHTLTDTVLRCTKSTPVQQEEPSSITQTIFCDYYESPASAGTGEELGDGRTRQLRILATPEAEEADCVIRVNGRSMEDTFQDGDFVLVRYQQEIEEGEIGIFRQNGKGYIKEAGRDRLLSHNPDFPDVYPSDGDIECIGLVLGKAEFPS